MRRKIRHGFRKFKRGAFCLFARKFPKQGAMLLPATVPLVTHLYKSMGTEFRGEAMVFLPGLGDFPEDYEFQGFIEAVRQSRPAVDMIVVDMHFGYYLR